MKSGVIVVVALLAGACEPSTSSESRLPEDEAASVTIDTTGSTSIVITREPEVRIGARDGPDGDALHLVSGALRLGDGRIVIANRGTSELRFYDAAGKEISRVGRAGEGPGEFGILRTLSRMHGDTLAVWDSRLRRLTYIGPDGRILETVHPDIETRTSTSSVTGVARAWAAPVGTIIMLEDTELLDSHGEDGPTRDTAAILIHERTGEQRVRIGPLPGVEWLRRPGAGMVRPFGHLFLLALGRDYFYTGSGKPGRIDRYDYDGARLASLRIPLEPVPVSDADYTAVVDSFLLRLAEDSRPRARDYLHSFARPVARPVYSALFVDGLDRLWIRIHHPPWGQFQDWWVVDGEARAAARVRLPRDVTVLDASDDEVILIVRDALGVEQVHVHRLIATNQ
jgi:hypothetical protein